MATTLKILFVVAACAALVIAPYGPAWSSATKRRSKPHWTGSTPRTTARCRWGACLRRGNGCDYDIAAVRIVAPGAVVVTPGGPMLDPNSLLSIDGTVDLDFGNFSGGGVDAIGGYFYSAFNSGTLLGGNIGLLFSDGFTTDVFSAAGGVPQFFGYIATPGTQLTRLLVHSPSNLAAVDRMTVGNVAFQVPEPSTLCMVVTAALLGLLGLRARANSRGQPIARAANTGISAAR